MAERHVIFSSGAIGMALTEELLYRGLDVIYVDVSGQKPIHWPFHFQPLLQAEPSKDFLNQTASEAKTVYQCFVIQEMQRPSIQWPAWQRLLMEWASQKDSALVVLDSTTRFGLRQTTPITAQTLPEPDTHWGEILHQLALEWNAYLQQKKRKWVAGLASDLFGPYLDLGPFGKSLFLNALAGKRVVAPQELDQPHSFSFVPDIARALMVLGERSLAWGQNWILPTAPPVTLRQFFTQVADNLKKPLHLSQVSKTRMRMSALLTSNANQSPDPYAAFASPLTLLSRPIECAFGLQATPTKSAIADTHNWFEAFVEQKTVKKAPSLSSKIRQAKKQERIASLPR